MHTPTIYRSNMRPCKALPHKQASKMCSMGFLFWKSYEGGRWGGVGFVFIESGLMYLFKFLDVIGLLSRHHLKELI